MPINVNGNIDFPENPTELDLYVDEENTQWRFSGTEWAIFEPYHINDLSEVDTTDLEIGDVLEWDGTKYTNIKESTDLNNLSDVELTNIQDDDFLVFDGTDWINKAIKPPHFCSLYYGSLANPNTLGTIDPILIEFDVKYDPSDLWDNVNFKVVIKQAGVYLINAFYGLPGTTADHAEKIIIFDSNDVQKDIYHWYRFSDRSTASATNPDAMEILFYKQLEVGDYIQMWDERYKRYNATNPDAYTYEHYLIVEQIT